MFMKAILGWLASMLLVLGCGIARAQTDEAPPVVDPTERHFDLLKVGALSFTNVWVHRQTNYHILIRHDGGIYTIKLTDLPGTELAELKSQIGHLASVDAPEKQPKRSSWLDKVKTWFQESSPRTKIIWGSGTLLAVALLVLVFRRKESAPPS